MRSGEIRTDLADRREHARVFLRAPLRLARVTLRFSVAPWLIILRELAGLRRTGAESSSHIIRPAAIRIYSTRGRETARVAAEQRRAS